MAVWDALLEPDDLQATHRFVRTCEEAEIEGARYRHLTIHQDGELVAIATLCAMRVKLDLLSTGLARHAIHAIRGQRAGFLEVPLVFCGLPVSFGQSCLRTLHGADRGMLLEAIHHEAETFAAEVGARAVCFKEFTGAETEWLQPLLRHGYVPFPSLPSCRLPLRWPTFDAYVASMRAGYRRQVLASLRARDRLGITVRSVEDVASKAQLFCSLYDQVMRRAEFQLERLNLEFFAGLGRNLPAEASMLLVEREGEPLAAAILLRSRSVVTFLLAGIDYAQPREYQAYVHLVTGVVAEAIRLGASALEMGQTAYPLKQRLGAVTTPRTLFLRWRGPLMHRLLRRFGRALFPHVEPPSRQVFRDTPGTRRAKPAAPER